MRQSEQALRCPYCGERVTVLVDHSVDVQTYIEDCEVCCRPITLTVVVDEDEQRVRLEVRRGDD